MKKYLTEKNLMWAAIAVLGVLHFFPQLGKGDARSEGMRQRMSRMHQQKGSMGDRGRGAWIKEKKDGVKEGRKKAPKDAK
jgi:hypothetical protein